MLARALRLVAVIAVVAAAAFVASQVGRGATLLTLAAMLVGALAVLVWLPRAAHRSFAAGHYRRAAVLYHLLRWVRLGRNARASVQVSLAACALGTGSSERALELLDRIEPDRLSDAVRAAWLNNRAYALARDGREPARALAESEEAIALRPDVAGFRHTRGIALLGVGRVDDAIRELDALWSQLAGDETRPLLEAERCYDLGLAWRHKGESDYATDYFERARRAAPGSIWAERAADHLDDRPKIAQLDRMIS